MNLSPEHKVALTRAVVTGVSVAGLAFFTTLAASSIETAAIAAGTAFFGIFAARFGVEGEIDTRRASAGE